MEDHFWPAVYPGLGVGLLLGLAMGGWSNAMLGALGGLIAAALSFALIGPFLAEEGLLPLLALIALSLLGAFCLIHVARFVMQQRTRPPA